VLTLHTPRASTIANSDQQKRISSSQHSTWCWHSTRSSFIIIPALRRIVERKGRWMLRAAPKCRERSRGPRSFRTECAAILYDPVVLRDRVSFCTFESCTDFDPVYQPVKLQCHPSLTHTPRELPVEGVKEVALSTTQIHVT
jgi:hypothetical protein